MRFLAKKMPFIVIAVLTLLWFLLFMFPFVMALLFCPHMSEMCILPERFGFYLLDGKFPLTEQMVYFLDDLSRIHRYFSITKLGWMIVLLFSAALGCITYWLGLKIRAWWRKRKTTP